MTAIITILTVTFYVAAWACVFMRWYEILFLEGWGRAIDEFGTNK